MYHCFLIHSSADGHLGCFHVLAIINSAAMNFGVHVSLSILTSLVAHTVKRLPAMRETQVQFLGREGPLEKEMAIHSSTLVWKIPWMEEPDRLQSMGSHRVGHN